MSNALFEVNDHSDLILPGIDTDDLIQDFGGDSSDIFNSLNEFEAGNDELDQVLKQLVSQSDEDFNLEKRRRTSSGGNTGKVLRNSRHASQNEEDVEDDSDDDNDQDDDIDMLPNTEGPLPHPEYSLAQSLVAKKMSKLSMKEREAVYYDIHGVSDAIDEEAEIDFLDRNLAMMEQELRKINSEERKAIDKARSLNEAYVNDRDFRLRFLRADRFNAKLAADRYARHYQTKLELFGPDKLARDIIQDDLGDEALHNLYSGMNQILPRRDNAGRLVWIWIPAAQEKAYSEEAILRRVFYNNMMISEDLETQRKGSVGIFYTLNFQQHRRGTKGRNSLRSISGIARSLPMPIVSVHFCYNSLAWLPVLSVAQLSVHLFIRLRIRAHFGSHFECMYKLQTFGIPADTIPIDENGNFNGDRHKQFLKKRRTQEREWAQQIDNNKNTPIDKGSDVSVPVGSDVLLGRGRGYFNHVGNIRYRVLIEDRKDAYDNACKKDKRKIVDEVIKIVKDSGGRFLKDDDGSWVPIDIIAARHKVGHSFRALRAPAQDKSDDPQSGEKTVTAAPRAKRMLR